MINLCNQFLLLNRPPSVNAHTDRQSRQLDDTASDWMIIWPSTVMNSFMAVAPSFTMVKTRSGARSSEKNCRTSVSTLSDWQNWMLVKLKTSWIPDAWTDMRFPVREHFVFICLHFSTFQYLQYTICSWVYQTLSNNSCKIPKKSHFLTIVIACATFLSTR